MANPPKTEAEHRLNGTWREDRKHTYAKTTPVAVVPVAKTTSLGSAPKHLSQAEKDCWKEIAKPRRHLTALDRVNLETAAALLAKDRQARADASRRTPGRAKVKFTSVDRVSLRQAMEALDAGTPTKVERSKVASIQAAPLQVAAPSMLTNKQQQSIEDHLGWVWFCQTLEELQECVRKIHAIDPNHDWTSETSLHCLYLADREYGIGNPYRKQRSTEAEEYTAYITSLTGGAELRCAWTT